jgi:hypothetical protein
MNLNRIPLALALVRIFHEARCARREKCAETGRPWPVSLSPTGYVGPIVPTQPVGSKFLRCASEFASASMHLLAGTMRSRAMFGLVCIIVSSTGCATNSELAKVRTEAHDARQVADRALSVAQEADRRSERTEEMVSRSFKHSMRK